MFKVEYSKYVFHCLSMLYLKESKGRTNLVVKYSIVVGNSTVRFCGLTLMNTMVERFIVSKDTSVRFCRFALYY